MPCHVFKPVKISDSGRAGFCNSPGVVDLHNMHCVAGCRQPIEQHTCMPDVLAIQTIKQETGIMGPKTCICNNRVNPVVPLLPLVWLIRITCTVWLIGCLQPIEQQACMPDVLAVQTTKLETSTMGPKTCICNNRVTSVVPLHHSQRPLQD